MLKRRDFVAAGGILATLGWSRMATAPRYPAPGDMSGAPFGDPNLKFAILSSLIDKQLIDLGTPQQLAEHVLGRPVDLENEGYKPIPAVRAYLDRYPLSTDLLSQIDELVLDGGSSIYRYVWFFWDGEDDIFDFTQPCRDQALPEHKSLDLTSMIGTVDLRDLLPPFKIETINAGIALEDIPALLDMPSLRSVRVLDDQLYADVTTPGHPNRQVMEVLKARRISVWVHWVSSYDENRAAYQ